MRSHAPKSYLKGRHAGFSETHGRIARQRGVGMVEILVAIVIASFALLGLAGLHITSMRYQKVAHFRSLAAQYGAEMADRIRANMAGAIAGNYAITTAYAAGAGDQPSCTDASKCTAAEMAAIDLYNWRVNLARGMTQGWGEVAGNVADGFTVRVYFREPDKKDGIRDPNCNADALDANAAKDTDVRCFNLVFVP